MQPRVRQVCEMRLQTAGRKRLTTSWVLGDPPKTPAPAHLGAPLDTMQVQGALHTLAESPVGCGP